MSRYHGQVRTRIIERDFQHIIEVVIPLGGLGKTLDAMYEFHVWYGIKAKRSLGRRDESGRNCVRFCFADPVIAKEFANAFAPSD
jgi:hypothetical protein